jgi:hypothetical protein
MLKTPTGPGRQQGLRNLMVRFRRAPTKVFGLALNIAETIWSSSSGPSKPPSIRIDGKALRIKNTDKG